MPEDRKSSAEDEEEREEKRLVEKRAAMLNIRGTENEALYILLTQYIDTRFV